MVYTCTKYKQMDIPKLFKYIHKTNLHTNIKQYIPIYPKNTEKLILRLGVVLGHEFICMELGRERSR